MISLTLSLSVPMGYHIDDDDDIFVCGSGTYVDCNAMYEESTYDQLIDDFDSLFDFIPSYGTHIMPATYGIPYVAVEPKYHESIYDLDWSDDWQMDQMDLQDEWHQSQRISLNDLISEMKPKYQYVYSTKQSGSTYGEGLDMNQGPECIPYEYTYHDPEWGTSIIRVDHHCMSWSEHMPIIETVWPDANHHIITKTYGHHTYTYEYARSDDGIFMLENLTFN